MAQERQLTHHNPGVNKIIENILNTITEIRKINASNVPKKVKAEALLFRLTNLGELFNELKKTLANNHIKVKLSYWDFILQAVELRNLFVHGYKSDYGIDHILTVCKQFITSLDEAKPKNQPSFFEDIFNENHIHDFSKLTGFFKLIVSQFSIPEQRNPIEHLNTIQLLIEKLHELKAYQNSLILQRNNPGASSSGSLGTFSTHSTAVAPTSTSAPTSATTRSESDSSGTNAKTAGETDSPLEIDIATTEAAIQNCVTIIVKLLFGTNSWILEFMQPLIGDFSNENSLYKRLLDSYNARGTAVHQAFNLTPTQLTQAIQNIEELTPIVNGAYFCVKTLNYSMSYLNSEIASNICSQVTAYKEQAKQAQTLQQTSQALQQQVDRLIQNNTAHTTTISSQTTTIHSLQGQLNQQLTQINQRTLELQQATTKVQQTEKSLNSTEEKLTKMHDTSTIQQEKIERLTKELTEKNDTIAQIEKDKSTLQGKIKVDEKKTKDLKESKEKIETLENILKSKEEKIKKLETDNQIQENTIQTLQQENSEKKAGLTKEKQKNTTLQEASKTDKAKITQQDTEIKQQSDTIKKLQEENSEKAKDAAKSKRWMKGSMITTGIVIGGAMGNFVFPGFGGILGGVLMGGVLTGATATYLNQSTANTSTITAAAQITTSLQEDNPPQSSHTLESSHQPIPSQQQALGGFGSPLSSRSEEKAKGAAIDFPEERKDAEKQHKKLN